jgi:hypothetical protein
MLVVHCMPSEMANDLPATLPTLYLLFDVMCCRLSLELSVAAQVSAIVSRVLRQSLLALTNHCSATAAAAAAAAAAGVGGAESGSVSGSSSVLHACGYMCREMGGDMKYLLVFHRPRVSIIAILIGGVGCVLAGTTMRNDVAVVCSGSCCIACTRCPIGWPRVICDCSWTCCHTI